MNQYRIKSLPETEQPYNKLENLSAKHLSDAELLSIIIKSGTKNQKAIDVAHNILRENGLLTLHQRSINELMAFEGIGRVKSIQLKAVAELSIRLSKSSHIKCNKVVSPNYVASLYMEQLRHLEQEHLMVVLLDTKNYIIKDNYVSKGTVNASLINPREVLIYCLKEQCVNYILLHNHPSGDPTPSQEDINITKRMAQASQLIGITLLDHIIIGDQSYTSLKQEGCY